MPVLTVQYKDTTADAVALAFKMAKKLKYFNGLLRNAGSQVNFFISL